MPQIKPVPNPTTLPSFSSMKTKTNSSMITFFFFTLLVLLSQQAQSATILVDGVSEWKNPSVHVGDTIIFKHKYHYNLYIFQNKNAFNLCNFTQSSLLTKPNSSSFTWYPSRPGFFYFTFNNGSLQTCEASQKFAIKVSVAVSSTTVPPKPSPEFPPMAAPTPSSGGSGGVVSSSPAYPWPFRPRQETSSSPGPAPISATNSPLTLPDKGGGIPFINSNPAVPLPTGEVDSATIRPLPASGHGRQVELGLLVGQMVFFFSVIFLVL